MPPATDASGIRDGYPDDAAYPSRTIAFQAAAMITSIVEALQAHDELKFTPAFMQVSLRLTLSFTNGVTACTAFSRLLSCMCTKCDHLTKPLSLLRKNE